MAPQPPPPALGGLRLGFADLTPVIWALETILDLADVPATPATSEAACATPEPQRIYALDGLRLEARITPLRPGGDAQRPHRADTLLWQSPDIAGQRQHLKRLGLCALDSADLDGPECLRLEAIETGACAAEWHTAVSAAPSAPFLGLVGIELRVRAPERTASHWAALLDAELGRDRGGAPVLRAWPAALHFVPAPESAGTGISALMFAAPHARRLAQRAAEQGLLVAADASWAAGGLRMRSAPPA
ncbi:MAG: hypothetical protein EOO29_26895 [Comamonadaceae bacterium]|nr:MAG: hypothetical protein EOO29_26895 [Comamonadaceae bacterium]